MSLADVVPTMVLPAVAVLVGVAAVLRARDLLPGRRRDRRGLAVALAGLAVGTTALVWPVYDALTRVTDVANVGEPIARTALMVCAVGVLAMISHLAGTEPRRGGGRWSWLRLRRTWLLAAVAVLWACFAWGPQAGQTGTYIHQYAEDPAVQLYLLVFLAFVGGAFADLLRLGLRMRATLAGPLATSGRLIAIGGLAGSCYVVVRLVGLVAAPLGAAGLDAAVTWPGASLAALASVLLVTGTLWPAVRSRVRAALQGLSAHAASTRLYPMWSDVVRLRPAVAMEPDSGPVRAALGAREGRWRLYRRVIELRDGVRALQGGPVRLATTKPPTGPREAERGAERTATALAEVVTAVESGAPVAEMVIPVAPAGATVEAEAAWWSRVAGWYRVRRRQQQGQQTRRGRRGETSR